jgi:hypothetical protein
MTKANVELASLKLNAINKNSVLTERIVWHIRSVCPYDEKKSCPGNGAVLDRLAAESKTLSVGRPPITEAFFAFFNDREFENVANTDETSARTHG